MYQKKRVLGFVVRYRRYRIAVGNTMEPFWLARIKSIRRIGSTRKEAIRKALIEAGIEQQIP